MILYFAYESGDTLTFENYLETEYGTQRKIRNINLKNYSLRFTFSTQHNAREHPLFFSLKLLFSDISATVAVFLNSLIAK